MKKTKMADLTVEQLVDRYAEIGIEEDDAIWADKHNRVKRLIDEMRGIDNELMSRGIDARRALMRLYSHPNFQVRLNAAKETLAVAPVEARRVIQAIADSKLYPQAGDAGMCLSALDEGIFKPV